MFKKTLILILAVPFIALGAYLVLTKNNVNKVDQKSGNANPTVAATSTITPIPSQTGNQNTSGYEVDWLIVRDSKKIKLYSNLEPKLSSTDAKDKYLCSSLTSGGFYSEDNKHLGLFIGNAEKKSDYISSSLFNGILYVDKDGKFQISEKLSDESGIKLALQTGPILISNGEPVKLSLERDENARRVVAGISRKKELVLMVFYSKSQPTIGPNLESLPDLLDEIQTTTNIKFQSAINLDGGAHSAFITESAKITEIANPGSYFCIVN